MILTSGMEYFFGGGNLSSTLLNGTSLDNVSVIVSNETLFSDNDTEDTSGYTGSQHPTWLLRIGAPLMGLVAATGGVLNTLLAWVLGSAPDQSSMDVIQMNVALCDAVHGVLGIVIVIAISVTEEGPTLSIVNKVSALSMLANVTFEDLSSMLIMGLRTRQVKPKAHCPDAHN